MPDVTASTARYPYEATLHQGEIESLFLDSMRKDGLEVERPIVPISLQISEDPKEIADPHAYPVKVRHFPDLPTCCIVLEVNLFVHTAGRAKTLGQGIRR